MLRSPTLERLWETLAGSGLLGFGGRAGHRPIRTDAATQTCTPSMGEFTLRPTVCSVTGSAARDSGWRRGRVSAAVSQESSHGVGGAMRCGEGGVPVVRPRHAQEPRALHRPARQQALQACGGRTARELNCEGSAAQALRPPPKKSHPTSQVASSCRQRRRHSWHGKSSVNPENLERQADLPQERNG